MLLLALLVAEYVALVVLLVRARGVGATPFLLTAATLLPIYMGYVLLADGDSRGQMTLWAFTALLVGYLVIRTRPGDTVSTPPPIAIQPVAVVVAALVLYHLIVGGIPLLSDNVELARFDFTSSGLLGIPGRMYLFAVPLLACLAIKFPERSRSLSRRVTYIVLAVLIASRVSAGFKSSLLDVIAILFMAWASFAPKIGLWNLSRRFTVPLICAFIFAGMLYGTYATSSNAAGVSVGAALADRIFVNGSLPGTLVLQQPEAVQPLGQTPWGRDIEYIASKYLHLGSDPGFSFNQHVSAGVYHLPLSDSSYLVPVTVGGFPELVAQMGTGLALAVFAVLGAAFAGLERRVRSACSPVGYIYGIAALFALHDFITKGNAVYSLVNWGAVATALVLLQAFLPATVMQREKPLV